MVSTKIECDQEEVMLRKQAEILGTSATKELVVPVLVEGTTLHVIQIVPDRKSRLFMQGRWRFVVCVDGLLHQIMSPNAVAVAQAA
ncbi:hypothetical protein LA080_009122 [Diaporthe eres]|nr:hypothetical protein LA080_009122 [Diaporthe eres]